MMLRNHLASSSISDRALQTALQVFRCYDDCSEFHHLFTRLLKAVSPFFFCFFNLFVVLTGVSSVRSNCVTPK